MFCSYTFVVFDLNAISFIMKMKMAHFAFVLLLADDTLMLMGNHNLSIKLFPILFVWIVVFVIRVEYVGNWLAIGQQLLVCHLSVCKSHQKSSNGFMKTLKTDCVPLAFTVVIEPFKTKGYTTSEIKNWCQWDHIKTILMEYPKKTSETSYYSFY